MSTTSEKIMSICESIGYVEGLYVACDASVVNEQQNLKNFETVLTRLGIDHNESDKIDYHVTVMWEKERKPHDFPDDESLPLDSRVLTGLGNKLTYWTGHNGKTYLVLEIDSAELVSRHEKWKDMGIYPNFPDYRPHMTLMKEFDPTGKEDLIDKMNTFLRINPIKVTLSGERAEERAK